MVTEYKNLTVSKAAKKVINELYRVEGLGILIYASSDQRGEYKGFSALHDLIDANMFLPFVRDDNVNLLDGDYIDFCNNVMEEVTTLLDDGKWISIVPHQHLNLDGLRVGDKVGISPAGTSDYRSYLLGNITKVTKTTVTVEIDGNQNKYVATFNKSSGNERGSSGSYYCRSLTHVDNAIMVNLRRELRIEKDKLVNEADKLISKLSNSLKQFNKAELQNLTKVLESIIPQEKI
jgi:hypothetical protein